MSEIIRSRKIRPSSRLETSKGYKIDTKNVSSSDTLIVKIDHETKSFQKTYRFNGLDVSHKDSISFRVNDFGTHIDISWSGAKPIGTASSAMTVLKSTTKQQVIKAAVKSNSCSLTDIPLSEKMLMNEKNFKLAKDIDSIVPNSSGIYCIRISNINKLPKPFNKFLSERNHNIIYIGIASQSLNKRFLNQELRANGHGTFFRSLGAVLGFKPLKGSLVFKKNKRNYKFSPTDEQKIIDWINNNLIVNWVEFIEDFEISETELINKYQPLFNIAKNQFSLQLLSDLRKECVKIANSI